jgi:hypothetical protein
MAVRIRARAVRRCGELLTQFDARGDRTKSVAVHTSATTQREAAQKAGLSKHQQVQAVRVANVPEAEFSRQVEGPAPPTITALAEQGVKPRAPLVDLKGRDPDEFNQALHYLGPIREYANEVERLSHNDVLPILIDREREELRALIARIDAANYLSDSATRRPFEVIL